MLRLTLLLLLFLPACAINKWGSRCFDDGDCEASELVCVKADEANTHGICGYVDRLTCGKGTILDYDGDTAQCVPDPGLPPEPECGPGTVEDDNNRCVLPD